MINLPHVVARDINHKEGEGRSSIRKGGEEYSGRTETVGYGHYRAVKHKKTQIVGHSYRRVSEGRLMNSLK